MLLNYCATSCQTLAGLPLYPAGISDRAGVRACPSASSGSLAQVAHTDVTLDDLWALDLQKLAGWRCVQENTAGEEAFQDEEGWETDSAGAEGGAPGGHDGDQDGDEEDDEEEDGA